MYLWKCWRDTRGVLAVSLLLTGILLVFVLRQNIVLDHHVPFDKIPLIFPFFLTLQAFPVSFVAWLMGTFGVGRDLGDRGGSYVFTRPRSRAYFSMVRLGRRYGASDADRGAAEYGTWCSVTQDICCRWRSFPRQCCYRGQDGYARLHRLVELWRGIPSGGADL